MGRSRTRECSLNRGEISPQKVYNTGMIEVRILQEAEQELAGLPAAERGAIQNALLKLREFGDELGYPHSSQVKGTSLRELRPRRGRSPWRAFYVKIGKQYFVVSAIGPEALSNPREFRRVIELAQRRVDDMEMKDDRSG
jgi:phage-related protein